MTEPTIKVLVAELQMLVDLAKDTRVSASAIGLRVCNSWPEYEKMIAALRSSDLARGRQES